MSTTMILPLGTSVIHLDRAAYTSSLDDRSFEAPDHHVRQLLLAGCAFSEPVSAAPVAESAPEPGPEAPSEPVEPGTEPPIEPEPEALEPTTAPVEPVP